MGLDVVSFKVDRALNLAMENYAKKRGITKSELIRRAVTRYMARNDARSGIPEYQTRRVKVYPWP